MTATTSEPHTSAGSIAEPAPPDAGFTPVRASGAVLVLGGLVLVASLLITPGPDPSHVTAAGWTPGHLLNGVAYLLFLLAAPGLAAAVRPRLGWIGALGIAGFLLRYATSFASQMYLALVMPTLAGHADTHATIVDGAGLHRLFGAAADPITLVCALLMLGLAWALWRTGVRIPAALVAVGALADVFLTPLALIVFTVAYLWLGLRIAGRGDLRTVKRRPM